jgi:hypothetical protein
MSEKITCSGCIHRKQGKEKSFCNNPRQTDERFKDYIYPPIHGCDLHEPIQTKQIWATQAKQSN